MDIMDFAIGFPNGNINIGAENTALFEVGIYVSNEP